MNGQTTSEPEDFKNQSASTSNILIQQYKIISDDMRFLSDQRFKIITVYIVINGFLINFIKDQTNLVIGLIGAFLSVMCLFWDIKTSIWWGTLITQAQNIEEKLPYEVYIRYKNQNPPKGFEKIAFLKPSIIIASIYTLGFILWTMYDIFNFGLSILKNILKFIT